MTLFVIFLLPETKGKDLENTFRTFQAHWFWRSRSRVRLPAHKCVHGCVCMGVYACMLSRAFAAHQHTPACRAAVACLVWICTSARSSGHTQTHACVAVTCSRPTRHDLCAWVPTSSSTVTARLHARAAELLHVLLTSSDSHACCRCQVLRCTAWRCREQGLRLLPQLARLCDLKFAACSGPAPLQADRISAGARGALYGAA